MSTDKKIKLNTIHKTTAGKNKSENQDSFLINTEEGVFIIADGMSGWNGKNASETAVKTISNSLQGRLNRSMNNDEIECVLNESLDQARNEVTSLQKKSGTTIDVGIIRNETFHLAHIGDSRVYILYNNDRLVQISDDMAKPQSSYRGREPQSEIEKKILSLTNSFMPLNWIGHHESQYDNTVQFEHMPLVDARRILMTTDGLIDLTLDNEIREALLIENLEEVSGKLQSYIMEPDTISTAFITHLPFFLDNHLKARSILSMLDPIFNLYSGDPNMGKMRDYYKKNTIPDSGYKNFILDYVNTFPHIKDCFLDYINKLLSFSDDTTFIVIEPKIRKRYYTDHKSPHLAEPEPNRG